MHGMGFVRISRVSYLFVFRDKTQEKPNIFILWRFDMTSKERHEIRYVRRKERRDKKKEAFYKKLPQYEEVFSFGNLYEAFSECKKGVRWKNSIQSYEMKLPVNISELHEKLMNQTWKTNGFTEFQICERGKMRKIQSVHISERVLQRCLCDNYLVPLLSRNLIYDNGASIKGKGTDFAIQRLKKHLSDHHKKYGNHGYVILYDFSNYFGSINHDVLYNITDKLISDEKIKSLYHQLIDVFGESGLGLGSQVNQISAVCFANRIDHVFKDELSIHGYGRYMDDGYIMCNSLSEVKYCKKRLYELCDELGITINSKKIKVCSVKNGFGFLKKRFRLKESGALVVKLGRKAIFAAKRRIKKMRSLYDCGKLTFNEAQQSYVCWRMSVIKKYSCYKSVIRMDRYFNRMFIEPFAKNGY